jgi:hypothetical protein
MVRSVAMTTPERDASIYVVPPKPLAAKPRIDTGC